MAALLLVAVGCKDKAAPKASGSDAMVKMAAFRDQMCACKDAACAKRVSQAMAEWGKNQPDNKPAALGADEQKRATDLGTQIGECMMHATAGTGSDAQKPTPAPSPTIDAGAGSGSAAPRKPRNTLGLPVECDDYKDAIDRIRTCEGMPATARETLVKGYEDASTRWSTLKEAGKATLNTACQGGLDAVLEVGKARCGW